MTHEPGGWDMATGTLKRGKTAGIPFRQSRTPVAVADLLPLSSCAVVVAERVQSIGRSRGCCAYVFVRDGKVYVLSEELPAALRWAVDHTAEWAGCFGGLTEVADMVQELVEFIR